MNSLRKEQTVASVEDRNQSRSSNAAAIDGIAGSTTTNISTIDSSQEQHATTIMTSVSCDLDKTDLTVEQGSSLEVRVDATVTNDVATTNDAPFQTNNQPQNIASSVEEGPR